MNSYPIIILETKRLFLRRLVMDDLNNLFALYRDPEIRRYFPEGVLNLEETKEELEWFLDGYPEHPELGLWATIHKATREVYWSVWFAAMDNRRAC
jgi:RimJ/RimL family protein N-acetyltransferase